MKLPLRVAFLGGLHCGLEAALDDSMPGVLFLVVEGTGVISVHRHAGFGGSRYQSVGHDRHRALFQFTSFHSVPEITNQK